MGMYWSPTLNPDNVTVVGGEGFSPPCSTFILQREGESGGQGEGERHRGNEEER